MKKNINPLFVLQKRAVRIITHNNEFIGLAGQLARSAPLFYETGLLDIYDIFKSQIAKFVFSCLNFTSPPQVHDYYIHVFQVFQVFISQKVITLVLGQAS